MIVKDVINRVLPECYVHKLIGKKFLSLQETANK